MYPGDRRLLGWRLRPGLLLLGWCHPLAAALLVPEASVIFLAIAFWLEEARFLLEAVVP